MPGDRRLPGCGAQPHHQAKRRHPGTTKDARPTAQCRACPGSAAHVRPLYGPRSPASRHRGPACPRAPGDPACPRAPGDPACPRAPGDEVRALQHHHVPHRSPPRAHQDHRRRRRSAQRAGRRRHRRPGRLARRTDPPARTPTHTRGPHLRAPPTSHRRGATARCKAGRLTTGRPRHSDDIPARYGTGGHSIFDPAPRAVRRGRHVGRPRPRGHRRPTPSPAASPTSSYTSAARAAHVGLRSAGDCRRRTPPRLQPTVWGGSDGPVRRVPRGRSRPARRARAPQCRACDVCRLSVAPGRSGASRPQIGFPRRYGSDPERDANLVVVVAPGVGHTMRPAGATAGR